MKIFVQFYDTLAISAFYNLRVYILLTILLYMYTVKKHLRVSYAQIYYALNTIRKSRKKTLIRNQQRHIFLMDNLVKLFTCFIKKGIK